MNIRDIDFQYAGVNFTYESSGCPQNCGCDGYNRCSRIMSTEVVSINVQSILDAINRKVNPLSKNKSVEKHRIFKYCIRRILRNLFISETDFEVNTCGGYYGEEISSVKVTQDFANKFHHHINNIEKLTPRKSIEYVLCMEYGKVNDEVLNCENMKLGSIKRDELDISNKAYYNAAKNTYIDEWDDKPDIPVCVCRKNVLIDGYHRVKSFKGNTIPCIIFE